MHCHQVKEALNAEFVRNGQWSRELAWRYPLPENLGFELEIDRGNVVKKVRQGNRITLGKKFQVISW